MGWRVTGQGRAPVPMLDAAAPLHASALTAPALPPARPGAGAAGDPGANPKGAG